ncbi:MAG TPA: MASE4 domain-containing protein [Burkholderiaceae bacterium]
MPDAGISLAETPVDRSHRYRALMVCLGFAAATAVFAPFASSDWPAVPAFFPAYQTVTAFCYAITAWMLFGDYRHGGRPSTLVLAAGAMWTALILLAQLLSAPGMFGPERVLGGDQTTIHLWMWWHLGPPLFALVYALVQKRTPARPLDADARRTVSTLTISGAAFAFLGVLVLVTRLHDQLPVLNHGADFSLINSTGVAPFVTLLSAAAAGAVWAVTGGRTVLSLWLVVSLVALVFDNLITMLGGHRNSVGWYVGRFEALASAATLLMAYQHHVHEIARAAAQNASALSVELAARERAERAMVEGRKLEGLGHLTGGVAHDFGNILQLLNNELELIRRRAPDEFTRQRAESALRTTARASKLTRQLLTFAKRQPLHFDTVDLNARIADIVEMTRGSVGRMTLELALAPDLWSIVTDANELDAAILNLIMNARDAMPEGGVLRIVTANAQAAGDDGDSADFVRVDFIDNGSGMTPAVLARAWEPFFTTKPAGKGTGLGLATVYGFVKQSGGDATLESSVGRGTTVTLRLPKGAPSGLPGDAEPSARILSLIRREAAQ